jgi:hypothetical protein
LQQHRQSHSALAVFDTLAQYFSIWLCAWQPTSAAYNSQVQYSVFPNTLLRHTKCLAWSYSIFGLHTWSIRQRLAAESNTQCKICVDNMPPRITGGNATGKGILHILKALAFFDQWCLVSNGTAKFRTPTTFLAS